MTNGFIEPFEGRQAPANCCSTLSSTPEKLAHRTNCVRVSRRGVFALYFTHGRVEPMMIALEMRELFSFKKHVIVFWLLHQR